MTGSADMNISGPNYRAFQRHVVNAAVQLRVKGEAEIFQAVLDNFGKGGVGIKTSARLQSDTLIEFEESLSDLLDTVSLDQSVAKIIWCRQLDKTQEDNLYEVGGKWLIFQCDWCSEKILFNQLHRTRESMLLCPACHKEISILESKGARRLKDSISRYLLGNVL